MKIIYNPNRYSQQRQNEKPVDIYPVHLAMEATYYKNQLKDVYWNPPLSEIDFIIKNNYETRIISEPEGLPFCDLPIPARGWTGAFEKKYQRYGNYKYHPATHMMAALDCWYAKCTFCDWAKKYPNVQTRSVSHVLEEVELCQMMGFKEIFDDSGTFPYGKWLETFCNERRKKKKIVIGCNMRISSPKQRPDFGLMKEAGFRMVLFGVESFNQITLDRLNKGIKATDIIPCIRNASLKGLDPHVALMVGYPWESLEEEMHTINLVKYMLIKGYAKTAQVSIYNTPEEKGIDRGTKHKIYNCAFSPEFWIRKLIDIKNLKDFLYLLKCIKKGVIRD